MLGKYTKQMVASLLIIIMAAGSIAQTASAIQSPAGCNSNRLNLSITRDKLTVQQGDMLTYTVTVSNFDSAVSIACDVDGATVTVTLPNLDGTPTGTVVTMTTTGNFPAGTPVTVLGTVPYIVNVNDGVTDATAEAEVVGVLHDAPTDHTAQISKTIGTTVTWDVETPPTTTETNPPSSSTLPGLPNTAI